MFASVAGFEFRYQVKSPVFWVAVVLFFLLTFLSVTSDTIQLGATSNVHLNAPTAIIQTLQIFCLFFMFVSTAFAAGVVVRDDETGFGPIVRSTRVTKAAYLMGRFCGAYAAVLLAFLAAPLAHMLGSAMPWLDPAKVGPLRIGDYLYAYVVLIVPTLFLLCAGFFALATVTRSMMATYLGLVAFLIVYLVAVALAAKPELRELMGYAEPFGIAAVGNATRYWTASDRNTLLPALSGILLWNRLIWTGVGAVFLALGYLLFRFEAPARKARKGGAKAAEAAASRASEPPLARPAFGAASLRAQLWARVRLDMGQVFKSPAFVVLLALGVFNSAGGMWFGVTDALYGDGIHPVTRVLIGILRGAFTFIPLVVSIYYAGELVWREQDRRTDEIVGATPAPDWVFAAPKILAITLVLAAMLAVSIVTAVAIQALRGFGAIELGKYIAWYLVPETIDAAQVAVLAVFLQTLAPHKFFGWGAMTVFLIALVAVPKLGFEHNLYLYASGPGVPLSDMNGTGLFGVARDWFRAYWSAVALVLAVLSYGLWRRGARVGLLARAKRLPRRLMGPSGAILAVGAAAAAGMGGFIYLNTNVWNAYRTTLEQERWQADYEKTFLNFEALAQPKITDVTLRVAIDPDGPGVTTDGSYVLQNKTGAPLSVVHVRADRDLVIKALALQGARPDKVYDRFNYRTFTLDRPMQPGERRTLTFATWRGQHGFKNHQNTTRIVHNGTFVNSIEIAPFIGMSRDQLLTDPAKRRKYGLPPQLRMPKLDDPAGRPFNVLMHDADWVNSDITVSTVADQTPMAPGYRVADRIEGGRHVSQFRTEAPILNFFSVQSARYVQRMADHRGVALTVYYDPHHPWNVDRMLAALKAGLDYDQANFGPYQFRQARILEFPDYAQFAQSFANTIPYSEGIGFIMDEADPAKIDMVTYVTAHELGHQWWAHQVIGANMQGGAMLSETFAQYTALMEMKHLYGPEQIRKFLKYELDSYLRSRGGEALEELPLARVEEQPYIYYRKGSLVMYRLQDEIGEEAVNRALRHLLHDWAFKGPPYPSTTDFLRDLRAEAGPQHQDLITDLFERITLYDLRTTKAEVRKRPDGRYDVTMTVQARKLYANGQGKETEAPLNEAFDVGVFAREPGKKGFVARDVIAVQHLPVRSGAQAFSFVTDREPAFAGVDPYNKAIDRNSDDNVLKVSR